MPVAFPVGRSEELKGIAAGQIAVKVPVDASLASPLLKCADGQFEEAEQEILSVLSANVDQCAKDPESLISLMAALFIVQRLDLVAALLKDKFGFGADFKIEFEKNGRIDSILTWKILQSGEHRFIYEAATLVGNHARSRILQLFWEFPLMSKYSSYRDVETGMVIVNLGDRGIVSGLAYCDSRPDYFLIPDYIFVPTQGYRSARTIFKENSIPWTQRKSVAFWRGSTTGVKTSEREWRTLERARLCELASRHQKTGLFDVGFSAIAQFRDPSVVKEIQESGLISGFVSWRDWGRYKYHIDIDGNSSAWSNLFQRLLTGSPVLKVESSRGLRQWYYDELIAWQNYVPVAPDMSDLVDKLKWLERNPSIAEAIGRGGLDLAEKLSYERELERACPIISAAFRYFSGVPQPEGPSERQTLP